jgi:hypothetical protein
MQRDLFAECTQVEGIFCEAASLSRQDLNGGPAMKAILGAMAAVALFVGVAATQPAEARCWWNGFATECWHPHHNWWWHRHYYPW